MELSALKARLRDAIQKAEAETRDLKRQGVDLRSHRVETPLTTLAGDFRSLAKLADSLADECYSRLDEVQRKEDREATVYDEVAQSL